jgi:hypothetical protein
MVISLFCGSYDQMQGGSIRRAPRPRVISGSVEYLLRPRFTARVIHGDFADVCKERPDFSVSEAEPGLGVFDAQLRGVERHGQATAFHTPRLGRAVDYGPFQLLDTILQLLTKGNILTQPAKGAGVHSPERSAFRQFPDVNGPRLLCLRTHALRTTEHGW